MDITNVKRTLNIIRPINEFFYINLKRLRKTLPSIEHDRNNECQNKSGNVNAVNPCSISAQAPPLKTEKKIINELF